MTENQWHTSLLDVAGSCSARTLHLCGNIAVAWASRRWAMPCRYNPPPRPP